MVHLNFQQIGRILDAVAASGLNAPTAAFPPERSSELDNAAVARQWRSSLSFDISLAFTNHRMTPEWTQPVSQRRLTDLKNVRQQASRLRRLTKTDRVAADLWRGAFELRKDGAEGSLSIETATHGLLLLEQAASREIRRLRKERGTAPLIDSGLSAGAAFVESMVRAFEDNFETSAVIVYEPDRSADRVPRGPFVAFVLSVLAEAKAQSESAPIATSPGAIAKAFERWKNGKKATEDPAGNH